MSLPYVVSEAIWAAKDTTETKVLKSDFERCSVTVIEVTTAAFTGTLDIQGILHEISAYANVPYIRQDQATVQTPSVSQISYVADTGTYRYVILGYWRRIQLVMTASDGTITCGAAGSSSANLFSYMTGGGMTPAQAAAMVTALQIIDNIVSGSEAQVDVVAALPAGTNKIGKVAEPVTVETPFTGTTDEDILAATHKITPGAAFKLVEISLHLSAAPTTGTQNLVLALDSAQGAAYDQVLLTIDLVANAVTDLTIKPDRHFQSGDVITAAWTNTDDKTWGLVYKHQLE